MGNNKVKCTAYLNQDVVKTGKIRAVMDGISFSAEVEKGLKAVEILQAEADARGVSFEQILDTVRQELGAQ